MRFFFNSTFLLGKKTKWNFWNKRHSRLKLFTTHSRRPPCGCFIVEKFHRYCVAVPHRPSPIASSPHRPIASSPIAFTLYTLHSTPQLRCSLPSFPSLIPFPILPREHRETTERTPREGPTTKKYQFLIFVSLFSLVSWVFLPHFCAVVRNNRTPASVSE